jgi:uncharacterized protein YjbI with pentapeptide repeats
MAEFNKETNFNHATFNKNVDFSGAKFSGEVNSVETIFNDSVEATFLRVKKVSRLSDLNSTLPYSILSGWYF